MRHTHRMDYATCARYPYPVSPSNRYDLLHDGEHRLTGTEQACWAHIHAMHSYSVEHAWTC